MSLTNKIAFLISNQLPAYIKDNYPVFADFLTAYYEFLESDTTSPNTLLQNSSNWTDIEETLDVFLPEFKKQYAHDLPDSTVLDLRRLIRYIHEYYEAKGSTNAVELFFRFVYGIDSTTYYPGQYILKASDGRWEQYNIVKLDNQAFTLENPYNLKDKIISIVYLENISTVGLVLRRIDNIKCFDVVEDLVPNIYRLTIDLSSYVFPLATQVVNYDINNDGILDNIGSLGDYDTYIYVQLQNTDGSYTTYGSLSKQIVSIDSISVEGSRFLLDETFTITESGSTQVYFAADYTDINNILGGGAQIYTSQDFSTKGIVSVSRQDEVNNNGIKELKIINSGQRFTAQTYQTVSGGVQYFASDYMVSDPDYAQDTQSILADTNFTIELTPMDTTGTQATVTFDTGIIFNQPGSFKGSRGFLSDVYRLEDNLFYQPYSYVVKSTKSQEVWKESYLKSNHPAGLALFSMYDTIDTQQYSTVFTPSFSAVSVTEVITITTQPLSQAITPPNGATLSVAASVSPYYILLTYLWQYSTDNATWNNVNDGGIYSGAVTDTLTISDVTTIVNNYYRCIVTGSYTSLASNSAQIT